MTQALSGVDRLFLLTPFVEQPLPLVQAALSAAADAGVEFVLRMSAAGADPNALLALAKHHGEGEEIVKSSGIAWSIVRPNFFMDNLINFAGESIRKEGVFYGAAGGGKVSYVSSRDVAGSAAAILADPTPHAGKTYELTGPEPWSESEVAEIVGGATGKAVGYVTLEHGKLRARLLSLGLPDWAIDGMVGLEAVKAQGWAAAVSPDVRDLAGRSETLADFAARVKGRWQ